MHVNWIHMSSLSIISPPYYVWGMCAHCMCWLSSSASQHTWIIYLKSSCFDHRNGAYDECRERRDSVCVCVCVCAYLFLSPYCFSLRDNWVPGGSIWSAEEWFPFIICHQFQQRLSGEAVSEARHTFQSDRWCWIVNRDCLSTFYVYYWAEKSRWFFYNAVLLTLSGKNVMSQ